MKIAVIWYFNQASHVFDNWRDGLRAAIEKIDRKHNIGWYLDKTMPDPGDCDFLLFWSSSNENFFNQLDQYKTEKKGICLTTDPHNIANLRKLDVVFVESQPIYDAVRMYGLRAIKAFGTDTDFFVPDPSVEKDIEYFYPATFSQWKKQDKIAHLGSKLLCVGTVQPDGREIVKYCRDKGVQVEEGYFPVKKILKYYQRAKRVIIPAVHGSERTVLEAMSCDILPKVIEKKINKRTYSYIKEYKQAKKNHPSLTPRQFVKDRYSHIQYANQLLKGIEK